MNRHAIPAAAAALAIVAAGCGSNGSKKDTGAATAASTKTGTSQPSTLPPGLAGSYTRFVSKADIKRTKAKRSEVGPNQSAPKPERFLLFFDPSAMTARTPSGDYVVQHDYSASTDGQLVIRGYQHPDVGAFCGPEIAQNATYTWKLSGDKLTLRAVKDPCADRDSTLTGVWSRK
jgi:hypothetical protein